MTYITVTDKGKYRCSHPLVNDVTLTKFYKNSKTNAVKIVLSVWTKTEGCETFEITSDSNGNFTASQIDSLLPRAEYFLTRLK